MVNQTQVKTRIANRFDRYLPECPQVFKSREGKASLMVMMQFSTPKEIVSLGARGVLVHWKTVCRHQASLRVYTQLRRPPEASIGLTEGLVAARIELSVLLEQYELYPKQEENIMTEVQQILENIPGTKRNAEHPRDWYFDHRWLLGRGR